MFTVIPNFNTIQHLQALALVKIQCAVIASSVHFTSSYKAEGYNTFLYLLLEVLLGQCYCLHITETSLFQ